MSTALSDRDILRELEPTAERLLNDHLRKAKSWNPHDYVPWDDGRNFAPSAELMGSRGHPGFPRSRRPR